MKDEQSPMYVVSAVSSSNGLGGLNTANYSYTGMKEHQTGRGNLGFHTMTMVGADGIKSVTTNNQTFPYVGMAERVDVYQSNGTTLLSSSVNTFKCFTSSNPALCAPPAYSATASYGSTLYLPYVYSSTSYSWDLNGTALPTSTSTVNTLDAYGNTLSATATTSDGFSKTSTSVFFNDATNWRLGLPVKTSVTSTVPAAFSDTGATVTSPVARTTMYVYQLGVGTWNYQLKDEVVQPSNPFADGTTYAPAYTLGTDSLLTTHAYDLTYGYQNKVTVSGTGIVARSTSTAMDFVANTVTTTNALGHSETQTLDPKFGVPLSTTGPNGLVTTWTYDGFGRKVKELRADLTATTTSLTDHGSAGLYLSADIGSARYSSTTQVLNSSGTDMTPSVTVYYDILGRELRSETQGFNTATIYKDTAYDNLGRVKKASRPYFSSNTVYWTAPAYDALGRTYNVTTPDGAISSTTFNGLTTTMTAPTSSDGLTRTRTEVKNSQGQVVSVTDALNGVITYKYDAFGNLGKVTTTGTDGKTATITSTFDIRGRKTAMNDPDMGAWSYTYDVLGELLTQKDAKLQTATMTYDVLGRMTKRVEVEGTSTWTYDTAANGKGKLASVTGPTNSYARSYVYDSLGRPAIVGTSINTVLYNMSVGYDTGTGRVTNVQFPSTVAGFGNFAFYNNYDTRGFLTAVSSLANNGGTKYWQLDANGIDAQGRVISETLGNSTQTKRTYNPISDLLSDIDTTGPAGVVQDSNYTYYTGVPNLNTRSSYVSGFNYTETFAYDALNRVLSANLTGGASKAFAYDSLGNITSKTGVGSYTYGSATVGPHAVTGVTGTVNGVVNPTYSYDANGNQTVGAGRTLGYTSFNVPKSVTMAAISQSYAYDAEHQRIVMTEGAANTTTYINPRWDTGTHFEKEKKGNIDEYKHYIYAGGRPVAMYVVKRDNGTNTNSTYTRYLHTDHLGSVDVITSETGAIVERLGYDTWGKRRNANGTDSATQLTSTVDHHGYTGHEMNDSIGLINMNGRWYDPTLGRFMQADPTIQAPQNLQNYNRYSYVMNNPLSMTDPSGFNWLSKTWKKAWHSKAMHYVRMYYTAVHVIAANVAICVGSSGTACASSLYATAKGIEAYDMGVRDPGQMAVIAGVNYLRAYAVISAGNDFYNTAANSSGLLDGLENLAWKYGRQAGKNWMSKQLSENVMTRIHDPVLRMVLSEQFASIMFTPEDFAIDSQLDMGKVPDEIVFKDYEHYTKVLLANYMRDAVSHYQLLGPNSKYIAPFIFSDDPEKYLTTGRWKGDVSNYVLDVDYARHKKDYGQAAAVGIVVCGAMGC